MPNFQKLSGLLPVLIQDEATRQVLMLGFMNEEAYDKTIASQTVWFWSRTKKRLWQKGEESGNILNVVSIQSDCDEDTLLITVRPEGPTCHTGKVSCFADTIFSDLFDLILSRQKAMPPNSYTTSLFQKGLNHICAKIKEESGEVIQAAKKEGQKRLIEESADLLYHLLVLIAASEVEWNEVLDELKKRSK